MESIGENQLKKLISQISTKQWVGFIIALLTAAIFLGMTYSDIMNNIDSLQDDKADKSEVEILKNSVKNKIDKSEITGILRDITKLINKMEKVENIK